MKKLKMVLVLLFIVFFVGGCSCTSSMCTKDDLTAIKEAIETKWNSNDEYKAQLREEAITKDITSESAIAEYIQQNIDAKIEKEYEKHPKACLTNEESVDPNTGAKISGKSWGAAFKEGLLEGLIVYPISWLLITFANLFGGQGFSKVLSIVVTTIIIRLFMLIFTFKSQIQTQKMQLVQGEISVLSTKLRDPNLSEAEKNKISMKIFDIYKKNGINPLSSLIPTLVSLPIFLSVWSAVSQTLVIRSGEFLTLELGAELSGQVFSFNIAAIILFLLMSATQILSMKLPNIIRLKKANYKNREQIKESNKQMSLTTNIMLIMVLLTGFLLPSALAIYWTIGGIIGMIQTIVFQSEWFKNILEKISNKKNK